MKVAAIMKRKALEDLKHDTAVTIRKALDDAMVKAKKDGWTTDDLDELETEILDLVTGDDE